MISDFKEKETLTTTTNKLDTDWLEMNHFAASPISERKITKEFGNPARDKVRQPPGSPLSFSLTEATEIKFVMTLKRTNGKKACHLFKHLAKCANLVKLTPLILGSCFLDCCFFATKLPQIPLLHYFGCLQCEIFFL